MEEATVGENCEESGWETSTHWLDYIYDHLPAYDKGAKYRLITLQQMHNL
jgi:hypothetical protein